ncbi:MAG: PadR family transcriptional regulator [bacterium]|nr:PadR family transcriptional regulator [bacterium]
MRHISPDDVILGLLAKQRSYGYLLLEHFRSDTPLGRIWSLSTSQLYVILKRLEHREDIDGCEFFPDDAPPRTEYWLTPAGRFRFENWLHTPFPSAITRSIRTEFLSRLYIARLNNLPTQPIIDAQREACQRQHLLLIEQRDQSQDEITYLSLDLVVAEMNVMLEWLGRCERNATSPTIT